MTYYPDTSFLCSVYRRQEHTSAALALKQQLEEPLHFTSLLEFEFLQAIELQVWLRANDRTRGYGRREADKMIADWEADVATGINRRVPFDMPAVLSLSKSLSLRNTSTGGHRTMDIFHIATAVHLGAEKFLTFDARQKILAGMAGLEVSC